MTWTYSSTSAPRRLRSAPAIRVEPFLVACPAPRAAQSLLRLIREGLGLVLGKDVGDELGDLQVGQELGAGLRQDRVGADLARDVEGSVAVVAAGERQDQEARSRERGNGPDAESISHRRALPGQVHRRTTC